jgi:DNA methylase
MAAVGPRRHAHPFPARMAPEIALEKVALLTRTNDVVLDPMCGSGTVVRVAAEQGRISIGTDVDPLAVLITRVAAQNLETANLEGRAKDVVGRARRLGEKLPSWIERDPETAAFVSYWFAPAQASALSRVARVLAGRPPRDDPLRVAMSRMIVTKDGGASLARDTAHSRPHRVRTENTFDVFEQFPLSAARLTTGLQVTDPRHRPRVRQTDARLLRFLSPGSVDLVLTSPPYLNAIDYLRGHRLSLIWMGWTLAALRSLRAEAVGAERALEAVPAELQALVAAASPRSEALPPRWYQMVVRFAGDMDRLSHSLARVTKRGGHLVYVVADSRLRGVAVSNEGIAVATAGRNGFRLIDRNVRPLPARHRYLPPPGTATSTLARRMKDEVVLTFERT